MKNPKVLTNISKDGWGGKKEDMPLGVQLIEHVLSVERISKVDFVL